MTLLDTSWTRAGGDSAPAAERGPRPADAATVLAVFVALQLVLPARLVMNGLPLSLSAASLVSLALGALWLCTQLTVTLGAAKGRNPVRTALFTYALVLIASYGHAAASYLPSDERSIGDRTMITVFALVFVALVVCDGVRSRARLYFLLHVMVVCGAFVAVVGMLQYLFAFDLTPHLRPPGMHFSSFDSSVGFRVGLTRAAGTTSTPVEFGVLCGMLLPLGVLVALRERHVGRRAAVWWACTALVGCGLMFSVSRSAIVGLLAAAAVLLLGWSARRRLWMLAAGIGFLAVIKVLSPGLLGTLRSLFQHAKDDTSVQWRTHDYETAGELISHHLWLGRGVGTWYAPKHEVFDNQYLLTLVDSGVIGLVAFLGIVLAALYACVRVGLWTRQHPAGIVAGAMDRDLALSLAASVAVVLPTFGTFDFMAFPMVSATLFLLVGACAALLRIVVADVRGEAPDPWAAG